MAEYVLPRLQLSIVVESVLQNSFWWVMLDKLGDQEGRWFNHGIVTCFLVQEMLDLKKMMILSF